MTGVPAVNLTAATWPSVPNQAGGPGGISEMTTKAGNQNLFGAAEAATTDKRLTVAAGVDAPHPQSPSSHTRSSPHSSHIPRCEGQAGKSHTLRRKPPRTSTGIPW